MRLGGWDLALGAGAGLLAFAFYLRTLTPTVLYYSRETFDAAHLQVVAYVLGIPSYTGYPTYAMLAHLFAYLPFGEPAYRVNLLSAVCAALAVGLLYLVCRKLGAPKAGAAFGALAFGLSETFWSQAVIAEVYALHVLFVAAFLLVLLLWREDANREQRSGGSLRAEPLLLTAAFLFGVAMTNHLTSIFLLPAAFVFVLLASPAVLKKPGLWAKGAGLLVLGLAPYLYLPLRAAGDPPLLGAGQAGDPSTFAGFFDLVSGGVHKGRLFAFGPGELPERFGLYVWHLTDNLNPILLALALLGFVVLLVRDRASAALLGAVFVLNLVYALEYDIEDLEIYFVPTYLVLCLLVSRGAGALLGVRRRAFRYPALAGVAVAAGVTAGFLPGTYGAVDRSGDFKGRDMIEAVVRETEPEATLLYHDGSTFHYMQIVEDRRTDVRLVDPFYSQDWVGAADDATKEGRVYTMEPGLTNMRSFKEAGYELVPVEEDVQLYEVVEQ